jgi:hypothetical protein
MPTSPKQRFLRSKALAERVDNFLTSADFQAAADAAMMQVVTDIGDNAEPNAAAAAHHRLAGAKMFLKTLQSISEHPKPSPRKKPQDNLHHNT